MGTRDSGAVLVLATAAIAGLLATAEAAVGQEQSYEPPRTADGRPVLNGIWQALGSAHWDIEGHAARPGPIVSLGAIGAIPGGLGVVNGGPIPYQPWAAAQKLQNFENWVTADPVVKCYMPGVPRATYMPFPFQIVQTPDHVLIAYEFASSSRVIYMSQPDFESPFDTWMGHSRGHWEGDTLVVDVTAQVGDTWFDSAGNFHTEALRVTERYTPISPNALRDEVAMEDPNVFTRPWTMSMPLYRRLDENVQLLEFKCVEFVEELIYGHLRKDPTR